MPAEGNIDDYAQAMDAALSEQRSYSTYNKDIHHATVAVCLSIRYAKDEVLILSQKLDRNLYAGTWFLDEAESFLEDRTGRMRLLVETPLDDLKRDHHPILLLKDRYPAGLSIEYVPESVTDMYDYNFMVADSFGYRFEPDRTESKAIVAVHPSGARAGLVATLKTAFNTIAERSKRERHRTQEA